MATPAFVQGHKHEGARPDHLPERHSDHHRRTQEPADGADREDAIRQYQYDRDPNDLIFQFKKRTLVHFAVDPDLVFMTTKLAGKSTFFLPFNKGDGMGGGKPASAEGKYKTSYLWEQVWQRDSLLDILARFVHLEAIEATSPARRSEERTMIFPRYHQLDAVRKLETAARAEGAGYNYL